jgi:hypothetical protein
MTATWIRFKRYVSASPDFKEVLKLVTINIFESVAFEKSLFAFENMSSARKSFSRE